jgi:probable rRNA maturation factor
MRRMAISIDSPDVFARLAVPLRAVVRAVLLQEKRRAGDIAVVLTGDDELRELNRGWRKIDRATDVISFAYDENEPDAATRPVTGDIAVSMDRVAEQAKRFRVTQGTELARLVVHGTLHLCGHDHVKDGERKLMRAREDSVLRAVKTVATRLDAAWPKAPRAPKPPAPRPRDARGRTR